MTVVVGTAGHIDHGKTALLRALTGIDADRLPEERRRGMTIDVGFAHLALPDGSELDFVDVPGHDRLVGNMLVGAGEIDAALLVVAADDGPRAQTLEHLELLDALGVEPAVAVVTKVDLVGADRQAAVVDAVAALLRPTRLRRAPVLVASAQTGEGLEGLRAALLALRDDVERGASSPRNAGAPRLAVDRVFSVRGRGVVVTGTLRGAGLERGTAMRLLPDGAGVRVREVQVHGRAVDAAGPGRTAVNLVGVELETIRRGMVLTTDPAVEAADRVLVALRPATRPDDGPARLPAHGDHLRLHVGTEAVGALVALTGPDGPPLGDGSTAVLRLERPVALAVGDRFVLRRPSGGGAATGGVVLDPRPPRGFVRRRATAARLAALAAAVSRADGTAVAAAIVDLRGAVRLATIEAVAAHFGRPVPAALLRSGPAVVAGDVAATAGARAAAAVAAHHRDRPLEPGLSLAAVRSVVAASLRRSTALAGEDAGPVSVAFVDALVAAGRLVRDGDRVRLPSHEPALPPNVLAAMDRLEGALSTPSPPGLAATAREVGCPPEGLRALEASGRVVRLGDDLAYAATSLAELEERAVALAAAGPLTPAAFRDEIGSSRRYVMALLEDFDRRGILRRTADGHVPGPAARTAASTVPR